MNSTQGIVTRSVVFSAAMAMVLGAASSLYAGGIPRGKNTEHGPYGLPTLKKVSEACSLSHDEEQLVLRIYNQYKHQEHTEIQQKTPNPSGRQDCINAVKQVLTPDEQKKFDSLVSQGKGKKKT